MSKQELTSKPLKQMSYKIRHIAN